MARCTAIASGSATAGYCTSTASPGATRRLQSQISAAWASGVVLAEVGDGVGSVMRGSGGERRSRALHLREVLAEVLAQRLAHELAFLLAGHAVAAEQLLRGGDLGAVHRPPRAELLPEELECALPTNRRCCGADRAAPRGSERAPATAARRGGRPRGPSGPPSYATDGAFSFSGRGPVRALLRHGGEVTRARRTVPCPRLRPRPPLAADRRRCRARRPRAPPRRVPASR